MPWPAISPVRWWRCSTSRARYQGGQLTATATARAATTPDRGGPVRRSLRPPRRHHRPPRAGTRVRHRAPGPGGGERGHRHDPHRVLRPVSGRVAVSDGLAGRRAPGWASPPASGHDNVRRAAGRGRPGPLRGQAGRALGWSIPDQTLPIPSGHDQGSSGSLLPLGRHAGRVRARRRRRFGEITDDLLYHGDLNAALRRMMQQGFRDQDGERSRASGRCSRSCAAVARPARALRPGRRVRRHRPEAARRGRRAAPRPAGRGGRRRRVGRQAPSGDHRAGGGRAQLSSTALARSGRSGQGPPGVRVHRARPANSSKSCSTSCASSSLRDTSTSWPGMSEMSPSSSARMKDMLAASTRCSSSPAGQGARLRPVHGPLRGLLPREPAEPRRTARADGAADGADAGCSTR